ncbi:hypothetical protein C1645_544024 [Glomus cerebriforme]|uniref:Uncharacterized protein n=1 Tax=Glomus cerebriforme TaxID=658196 RepID=A0A397TEH0_9GLOM|nr:hypothetical protein C1645_544024 [Glomus cerebriforme]
MNYIQILAYAGFWLGAVIMINIHNLIASILLCRIHKVNVSTILKIIFTFGQIVQSVGNFGIYMTPETATFVQCAALQSFISVGNIITRLSLSAFLLWRLRQLDNNKKSIDKLVCIVLFTIRAAFTVSFLFKNTHFFLKEIIILQL